MEKLPKKVFVAWMEERNTDKFLGVATELESLVEQGEKKMVGIYELKEVKTAINKTEFK